MESLRIVFGVILIVALYVIVYYRLMIRYHYEKATGNKETTIGAIFTAPPISKVPKDKRHYVVRYFIAVGVLTAAIIAIALVFEVKR